MPRQPVYLHLVLLTVVAAIATAFVLTSGDELRYPDENAYYAHAVDLADGRGFVTPDGRPTAYRPPGYPLFLSGVYRLWERPLAGKLANVGCLLAASWLTFLLTQRSSRAGAPISLALIAAFPIFSYASSTLYPQLLASVLLVGSVLLLGTGPESRRVALAVGLMFGAASLAVPSFLLVFPIIVSYLALTNRHRPAAAVARVLIATFGLVAVLLPWTVRNFRQFGALVPVATNSGENFLLGNSENTTPDGGATVDISQFRAAAEPLGEVDRDRFYRQQAFAWVADNPTAALSLYLRKVINYFNYRNVLVTESESSRLRELVLLLTYWPVLIMGVGRLLYLLRAPLTRIELLFSALYFGNALASAVFFTRIRFRIPFDFLLIALAASFVGHLIERRSRGRPGAMNPDKDQHPVQGACRASANGDEGVAAVYL